MKPVEQLVSDGEVGDCMRAVVASLLELQTEQVPHFRLFETLNPRKLPNKAGGWFSVFSYFLMANGYKLGHNKHFNSGDPLAEDSINGHFFAVVNSRNFEGTHAVVMDMNGVVVHDPSPTKKWQGESLRDNPDFHFWYTTEEYKPFFYMR